MMIKIKKARQTTEVVGKLSPNKNFFKENVYKKVTNQSENVREQNFWRRE